MKNPNSPSNMSDIITINIMAQTGNPLVLVGTIGSGFEWGLIFLKTLGLSLPTSLLKVNITSYSSKSPSVDTTISSGL